MKLNLFMMAFGDGISGIYYFIIFCSQIINLKSMDKKEICSSFKCSLCKHLSMKKLFKYCIIDDETSSKDEETNEKEMEMENEPEVVMKDDVIENVN